MTTLLKLGVFAFICFTSHVQCLDIMPSQLADLQGLNNAELNELYDYGSAYDIPSASQPGPPLLLTGLPLPVPGFEGPSKLFNFFWGGKIFTTNQVGDTSLTNKILPNTPFTFNDVSAQVTIKNNSYTADGESVIFLNYENSNIAMARIVRDEMRLIAPGLYLGRAYLKNGFVKRLMTGEAFGFALWFALKVAG